MEVKDRARTRKAIKRAQKEANRKILKAELIKFIKRAVITLAIAIVVVVGFFVIEIIRFNKADGCKPGICAVKQDVDLEAKTITYKGIGYTFTYTYSELETNDDIETKRIGGEFKLFGKKVIAAWIE